MWDRAAGIGEVSERHGVPLLAAAVRFPLGHPQVRSVVVGCLTAAELSADVAAYRTPIPAAFWAARARAAARRRTHPGLRCH